GQTITTTHSWSTKGTYEIKVKAKDIHGNEGAWSNPLSVKIPRTLSTHGFLQHFKNIFPILRKIIIF
ncbi:MAG: hypothetical protein ACQXXF_07440, partial [Thermoplasmatota archaeon]